MPQMAPMSWLILFFIFTITYLIFYLINYYTIIYNPKETSYKTSKSIMNWKW